jgi:hypothetical protein
MPIILTKYGNTVAITTTTNKVFYMSVKQFLNAFTLNKSGPEGANIITNGTFTGNATGWVLGAGWTYGTDKVSHSSGVNKLTQAGAVVSKQRYIIRLTVTGTTGSVTVAVGGVSNVVNAGAGAVTLEVIATTTGGGFKIQVTPTNDFNGSIDTVSVKPKPYLITLDTDRLDEQNIDVSAWTIAGNSGLSTIEEVGDAISDLVKYDI